MADELDKMLEDIEAEKMAAPASAQIPAPHPV